VTIPIEVLRPAYRFQFCWAYWGDTQDAPSFSRLRRVVMRVEWYEMALKLFKNLLSYQRKWKYAYVMARQKQQSLWLVAWLPGCLSITYIIYHNFHWQCCSSPIHRMTLMASDGNVPLVVRRKFVVRNFTPAEQCECRLRSLI